jgi:hypothetical protein
LPYETGLLTPISSTRQVSFYAPIFLKLVPLGTPTGIFRPHR